jgi:hypothetical protein
VGLGPIRDLTLRFALSCSVNEDPGMDEALNGSGGHGGHGRQNYGGGGRKRRYRGTFLYILGERKELGLTRLSTKAWGFSALANI